MARKSVEEREVAFIKKAQTEHQNPDGTPKYIYPTGYYKNISTKLPIICSIHGEFWQTPNNHIHYGCGKCGMMNSGINMRQSLDNFIKDAKIIHNNFYEYTLTTYTGRHKKIDIICPVHGIFRQTANSHLRGHGCPECAKVIRGNNQKYTTDMFIDIARNKHNDYYTYTNVSYINSKTKVSITCPTHGDFWQTPNDHLSGKGCPDCHIDYSDPSYTHYVYKITNTINDMIYIGIHSTKCNNIYDSYMGSGTLLKRAQREYGLEYFNKEILHICDTREETQILERELVNTEFISRCNTYNLIIGG